MSYTLRTLFVFLVLLGASFAPAYGQTTGNRFVTASVDQGLITIYKGTSAITPPSIRLSFHDKSFLSVKVGTKVYSNNPYGTSDVLLLNPTTTKSGDTIESVWPENGFDIVQDVYPLEFEISGQIVYKIKIVKHSGVALTAQAQYLLDVDVNNNDAAPTLTRYNYTSNWMQYPNSQHGIPWFFMGFEHAPTSGNPGSISTGYLNDTLAPQPIGLMQPDMFAIVDWARETDSAWGLIPNPPLGTSYTDNALFIEWPAKMAAPNGKDTTIEIARGSYGTGEFEVCPGNLLGITFYPHRVKRDWKKNDYTPNSFNVESMIFNTSSTTDATNARASLTTSKASPIRIVLPSGVLAQPDGTYRQTQDIGIGITPGSGGTIPQLDVAEVHWVDSAVDVVNCNGDSSASLTLNVVASGIPQPAFASACEMPIIIECSNTDTLAPKVRATSGGRYDSTFVVTDNSAIDKGIRSISWAVTPSVYTASFPVGLSWAGGTSTTSPTSFDPTPGCWREPVTILVTQKDSTMSGCVDFVVTDCNGNTSYKAICFQAGVSPIHRDTLPPVFGLLNRSGRNGSPDTTCNAVCTDLIATDQRQNDGGLWYLDSVAGTSKNMVFNRDLMVVPTPSESFSLCVIDSLRDGSIVVMARDTSGNTSYDTVTYCATLVWVGVATHSDEPSLSLTVHPNPSAAIFAIALNQTSTMAKVEVLDILGHQVDSFKMDRAYDWDASRLASGIYIVRVTANGVTISKRIIKE